MLRLAILLTTLLCVLSSQELPAQDPNFSVQARLLGGLSVCTNADVGFTNADTRRIAPKASWNIEVMGLYNILSDRLYLSTGFGVLHWRYDARLRPDLLEPFSYDGARQGPGGSSFVIPIRAGLRIGKSFSVEAGWAYMRHVGRSPSAVDRYALRSDRGTLVAEVSNYRTRFSNGLLDATVSYRLASRVALHLRGSMGTQEFSGVSVVESIRFPSSDFIVYRTEGAARLAFVTAGIGVKL